MTSDTRKSDKLGAEQRRDVANTVSHLWGRAFDSEMDPAFLESFPGPTMNNENIGLPIGGGAWQGAVEWRRIPSLMTEQQGPATILLAAESRIVDEFKSDIAELKEKVTKALNAAQECLRRVDELSEQVGGRVGIGAIHSLNEGKVSLDRPIFVGYESSDGEVMASVEELRAYGVGRTRAAALKEVQDELWYLYQDLISTPTDQIGDGLQRTLRTLHSRINPNDVDA